MIVDDLREFIEKNGVKQVWLANKIGISESYLSLILSEDRVVTESIKTKIKSIIGESNE
tara:strand:- start:1238 stop:1414 length:177 start_codon:yes stop_codon:yes gene_type:complete